MDPRDGRLDDLAKRAAELAHDCWALRLQSAGWRSGPFDPSLKTHDALVPFDELARRDRRSAHIAVQAEEIVKQLGEMIEYERGPDREFLIEDVSMGRRVSAEGRAGTIIDWTTDGDELSSITVRFDDGEEISFNPVDGLLSRPDEA